MGVADDEDTFEAEADDMDLGDETELGIKKKQLADRARAKRRHDPQLDVTVDLINKKAKPHEYPEERSTTLVGFSPGARGAVFLAQNLSAHGAEDGFEVAIGTKAEVEDWAANREDATYIGWYDEKTQAEQVRMLTDRKRFTIAADFEEGGTPGVEEPAPPRVIVTPDPSAIPALPSAPSKDVVHVDPETGDHPYGHDFIYEAALTAAQKTPRGADSETAVRMARFATAVAGHESIFNQHNWEKRRVVNPWNFIWGKKFPIEARYLDHDTDVKARGKVNWAFPGLGGAPAAAEAFMRLLEQKKVWAVFLKGGGQNVNEAVSRMKETSYFTGDEVAYARAVRARYKE